MMNISELRLAIEQALFVKLLPHRSKALHTPVIVQVRNAKGVEATYAVDSGNTAYDDEVGAFIITAVPINK